MRCVETTKRNLSRVLLIVTIIFIQLQMITQKFVGLTVVGKGVGENVGNHVVPAVGFNVDVGDDVGGFNAMVSC